MLNVVRCYTIYNVRQHDLVNNTNPYTKPYIKQYKTLYNNLYYTIYIPIYMGYTWDIHGVYMGCIWGVYEGMCGVHIGFIWGIYGVQSTLCHKVRQIRSGVPPFAKTR